MKVILLNNNPAVSKLVSVSLNKLGYTFAEIDNLEYLTSNDADLIICDSGLYDSKIDYLEYAKNQLFLIPRNRADEYSIAKNQTLQKPFLPTDFIDMVKKILVEIPKPKLTKIVEPKPSNIKIGDEFGQVKDNMGFSDGDDLLDKVSSLQDDFVNSSFDDEFDDEEVFDEQELEQFENLIEVAEPKPTKTKAKENTDKSDEFDDGLGLDDELGKTESLIDESKESDGTSDDLTTDGADEFDLDNIDNELAKLDNLEDEMDKLTSGNMNESTDESINNLDIQTLDTNDKIQELSDVDFDIDDELKGLDDLDDESQALDSKIDEPKVVDELSSEQKSQNIKDLTSEYENIQLDISAFDDLPDGDDEPKDEIVDLETKFSQEIEDKEIKELSDEQPEQSELKDEFSDDLAIDTQEIAQFDEPNEQVAQSEEISDFQADEPKQNQLIQEPEDELQLQDESDNEFNELIDEPTQKAKPAFLVEEINLDGTSEFNPSEFDDDLAGLESELAGFENDLANIKSSTDEFDDELANFDENSEFNELADENDSTKDVEYTENLNKLSSMLDEIDNMDCENDMKNQDLSSSYEASTIDEIEEAAIKEALHEESQDETKESATTSITQSQKDDEITIENEVQLSQNEQNEIAHVLASQIGEGLGRAFSTSALKDVLKDININISISFEGR